MRQYQLSTVMSTSTSYLAVEAYLDKYYHRREDALISVGRCWLTKDAKLGDGVGERLHLDWRGIYLYGNREFYTLRNEMFWSMTFSSMSQVQMEEYEQYLDSQ